MSRRRLLPALLRSTAALATALALTVTGLVACDSEPEVIDPIAEGSDEDFRSLDQVAMAISQDPRFVQLMESAVVVAGQHLDGQNQMPPEFLEAHIVTINSPAFVEEMPLPEYLNFAGVDQALVDQQTAIAESLVIDYGLADLAPDVIRDVFEIAASTPEIDTLLEGAIEYELNPIDEPPPEEDECHDICHAQFVVAAAVAMHAYIAALAAAAAASVTGPAALIAVLIASASYAYAIYQANEALKNCRAACDGETSSTEECVRDSDCASDEFCWTGVLGWGQNECRPVKPLGDVCSRDGQCDSGCCKYHFFTNPVSMVCRPASKCS